jgi:hypothetical protein
MENEELTSSAYLKVRGGDNQNNGGGVSARSNGSAGDITRTLMSMSNGGDATNRMYE